MNVLDMIEREQMRGDIPSFKSGDTIKVYVRIVEGQKERLQLFEGVVIRKRAGGSRMNFTVRKVSHGVGAERTFPLHSPMIDRIEVVTRAGRLEDPNALASVRVLQEVAAEVEASITGSWVSVA